MQGRDKDRQNRARGSVSTNKTHPNVRNEPLAGNSRSKTRYKPTTKDLKGKKVSFDRKDDSLSLNGSVGTASIEMGSHMAPKTKMPKVSTKLTRTVNEASNNYANQDYSEKPMANAVNTGHRRQVTAQTHQQQVQPTLQDLGSTQKMSDMQRQHNQNLPPPPSFNISAAKSNINQVKPTKMPFNENVPSQRLYTEDGVGVGSDRSIWKAKYDPNQVYGIEKKLAMSDPRQEHLREIQRWRNADLKGSRKSYYVKEVVSKNNKIMTIVKQTRLEQAHNYTDGHKCLNFRKKILKFRIHISELALTITSNRYFEGFIILVISLNCITLAQSDSTKEETPVEKSIDLVFNIIYTVEMFLRVFSLGFIFGQGAYLRSAWNQLDFICVITAYMELLGGGSSSFAGLRAFRVLRPLRFVNNIEGLKIVVMSVMSAIPLLQDTILILLFFFLIFAIGGLNLFMGLLMQRCIAIDTGIPALDDEGEEIICSKEVCPPGYFCGKNTLNPNYDVTNFDNIAWALLNVFQCITMEGWSEIMVMYQKAYTPWVFFFFVPMVFIGAFFLLNLTLAVINSSYAESQGKIKAAKAKLKEEQEKLVMAAQKNAEDDDDDDTGATKGTNLNIGVNAFFVAKRAAVKMIAYWKAHQIEMKAQNDATRIKDKEEEMKLKEDEKIDTLRRQSTINKKSARRMSQMSPLSNASKDSKKVTHFPGSSTKNAKGNDHVNSQDFMVEDKNEQDHLNTQELEDAVISKLDGQRPDYKTISEEDSDSMKQSHRSSVEDFFAKTANVPAANVTNLAEQPRKSDRRGAEPIMAFNDVRIMGLNRDGKNFKTYERSQVPINAPQRNNLLASGTVGEAVVKGEEKDLEIDADIQHDWILDELDFEKVIKQREDQGAASIDVPDYADDQQQRKKKDLPQHGEDLYDSEHPLDLSFTRDKNYGKKAGGYASDNDMKHVKPDDQDSFSILSSNDESLNAKLNDNNISTIKPSKKELRDTKVRRSKEVNSKLKRMLTSDFKEKNQMNDSQSTFLGNNPSLKMQIDLFSNLMQDGKESIKGKGTGFGAFATLPADKDAMKEDRATMGQTFQSRNENRGMGGTLSVLSKHTRAKKEKIQIYQDIDREFFHNEKPTNPLEFINQNNQKVMINPGVPYVSTSQNEIFERRILLNQKEYLNKINPFIAAPKDDDDNAQVYEGAQEESYIVANYEAYQLKTLYQVKQVEEIDFDSDDEDALVLAQQPYETVAQTGFQDYLNHLSTRFIARRSDIIVSSTLSITLTPLEEDYTPTPFSTVDEQQIWEYVMLRQEYRAIDVASNILQPRGQQKRDIFRSMESSLTNPMKTDNNYNDGGSMGSMFDSDLGHDADSYASPGKIGEMSSYEHYRLPDTLLREPLDQKKELRLNKKEKRLYKLQKSKYEQVQKINSKKAIHPKDTAYSLADAHKLIEGNFHQYDEDEDLQTIAVINDNEAKVNLNRAMLCGKNDVQHEINLENFDIALQQAVTDLNHVKQHDPRNIGDHVPDELKKAFNLPKSMADYDIDFNQVRNVDSQFKKRLPIWSGQDVLDVGLNKAKSMWVLSKINKLRVWPKGFFNLVKKVRAVMKMFIRLSLFENFLTVCVLLNTVGMAMDAYDIDAETQANLEFMNEIFTWIFIVEMTLKLLARGPKKYSAERMNLLDGAVVILSIIEIIMEALGGGGGAGNLQAFRTVRVFRTFRVLRVTRVLRALKSMAMVIGVIQRSFMDFVLITILMFVFIFIYTLLGRQIFQGNFDFGPDEEMPRGNFESFTVAFVTVFQVLTMENWQQVLYASMYASQGSKAMKILTAIYYISWIFIGNFILLNLFLAILIDAFGDEDAELDEELSDKALEEQAAKKQKRVQEEKEKRMRKLGTTSAQMASMRKTQGAKKVVKKQTRANFTGQNILREADLADIEDMDSEEIRKMLVEHGILKPRKGDQIDFKLVGPEIHAENSVYLFNRSSCFRRNCHFVQKHRYFERFIMFLIALSSAKLAMESYIVNEPDTAPIKAISNEADFIFNYLFIVECVLKIIALGFIMDEGSYLRDSWNKLDFFIVTTSIVDMLLTGTDIPALKVLRMLRMIRPLRVISHNPQLKMIVAALFESIGSIVNVSVIVMIIWLMFAIYGMNTYMGKFFYCSVDKYKYGTKWTCQDNGGEWLRFDSNFDDIGQAMITLFIVASLEGWPDIMYQAIDVTRIDNGPKYEYSPAQSAFFIVFILIGAFFFLNFFIGVLFLKYEQAQKKEEAGFNKQQLYWQELQRMIVNAQCAHQLRYKPQTRGLQFKMWELVTGQPFDITIMACIVLNMLQMALDHEGASPGMLMFLKLSNYFFTAVFFFEAVLKLYVYRMAYFKTGWNKFDFFVVASSIIDLGLEFMIPVPEGGQTDDGGSQILSVGPQLARVLRVLRVSRVLRLAGKYKGLQSLLKTIMMSVDSLINVFILLMLIFFIMAVLGNTMFFEVTEGNVIDEWKNFVNFHQSFSLLFSISTGEDWNRIMFDCMRLPPDCIPGRTCGSSIAPMFFLSFIMLVTNIMLNLFILVIIQQFSKYYIEDDNPLERFETDFEEFQEAWMSYTDRYQCTKITIRKVPEFFKKLPLRMRLRLGISEYAKEEEINRVVLKMGINLDDGFIYFNEMLYRIMRTQFVTSIGLKFNRVMTVNELVVQYRVAELTMNEKMAKKADKMAMEQAFFVQLSSQPMNLFLTKMFYKTSFRAWKSYMEQYVRTLRWDKDQEKVRVRCAELGKLYTKMPMPTQTTQLEEVEIEREEILEMSLDSDEQNDDYGSKSHKSQGTIKMLSQWTKSQQNQESPELFRSKARKRMLNSSKKFSALDIVATAAMLNRATTNVSPDRRRRTGNFDGSVSNAGHIKIESPGLSSRNENDQSFYKLDPNSVAYTNAVLTSKINKHEKVKKSMVRKHTNPDVSGKKDNRSFNVSSNFGDYQGSYLKNRGEDDNLTPRRGGALSPSKLNAPFKTTIIPDKITRK